MSEFTDERGTITDLLEGAGAVTHITTTAGAIRGNHYHRRTWQTVLVLEGTLELVVRQPGEEPERFWLGEGQHWTSRPGEHHAWRALHDAACVVLTVGPRSGEAYESDTIRLDEPLIS